MTTDHKLDFTMKVVVGKVVGEHETPVFTHMMKYLIFRPYWNVPIDIVEEGAGAAHGDATAWATWRRKNFEVTNNKGEVQTDYTREAGGAGRRDGAGEAGAEELAGAGEVHVPERVRHLPAFDAGAASSSTGRGADFSHGCVRVQKPDELGGVGAAGTGATGISTRCRRR